MRWSITGTTTSAVHWCWAVSESVASGSNLRLSTTVEDRPRPSVKCTKPHEWKSGAAIIVVLARLAAGSRRAARPTGSSDLGCERDAPFGVPVVPEVRMIDLPGSAGGTTSDVSPLSIRSSSGGSRDFGASGSCQAM